MEVIGRYSIFDDLARGGMATVYIGRFVGPGGFSRTVAVKRLHPHLAKDPEFVAMLLDEARLAGRIQHPNVVAMLDVVATAGEVVLVMEYVHGVALQRLLRATRDAGRPVSPGIAAAILVNTLHGLHAAHEVRGERGELLGLVHRDVTPHNIMIRRDGTALVVDFGVAKAAGRFHTTEEGQIKGKLPYMAPEQVRGKEVSRRTDICAAGAVLWELLVGERLVRGQTEAEVLEQLLFGQIDAPSSRVPAVPVTLDAVVLRALARDPQNRFATAAEMAAAIEAAMPPALPSQVAAWMKDLVGDVLQERDAMLAAIDSGISAAVDSQREPRAEVAPRVAAVPFAPTRSVAAPSLSARPLPAAAIAPAPAPAVTPEGGRAARLPSLLWLGVLAVPALLWFGLRSPWMKAAVEPSAVTTRPRRARSPRPPSRPPRPSTPPSSSRRRRWPHRCRATHPRLPARPRSSPPHPDRSLRRVPEPAQ
jgi:eukaryotic-like serine/threonine-protein kinase